ncbi:MAG: hypothetical protein NVSMB32_04390 [Actinomycetota bacterium]
MEHDTGLDPERVESLAGAPVGQGTPGEPGLAELLSDASQTGDTLAPEKMRAIVDSILTSGEFCRDTEGGGLLHPRGKIAFRQIATRNSLHVSIGEEDISVHVDHVSPLARNQADEHDCGHCNYSVPRVVAHVVTNLFSTVFHRPSRPQGDKRMEISTTGAQAATSGALGAPGRAGQGRAVPGAGDGAEGGAPLRIPFTPLDEAVYLLDNPVEPWTVQLEVRVGGRLDEERFRRALNIALAQHPMARARKAPTGAQGAGLAWEIARGPDVDPLTVCDCPDEVALTRERNDFYSLAIPLTTSPPLRMRLAHRPKGDVVMLSLHHCAIDAPGGLRVLASIARAYAGAPDPSPQVGVVDVRNFKTLLGPQGAGGRLRRILTSGAEVWRFSRRSAHLAGLGGQNRSGYGIHCQSLSPARSGALMNAGGPVLDAILVGALHRAVDTWNLQHDQPAQRITVGMPLNLRPAAWRSQIAGNFVCMVPVSTLPAGRQGSSVLLGTVARRIAHVRQADSAAALVGLLGVLQRLLPLPLKPAFVVRVTGNPFAPSALVHNLGEVDELSFGDDLPVDQLWFSPPAMMPEALSIGALSFGGQLRLSFRYRLALWGAGEAAHFALTYVEALGELAAAASQEAVLTAPGR